MKIRDGNLPIGKGTFIYRLTNLAQTFPSLRALVDQLVRDGYQWVAIKAQDGYMLGAGYYDDEVRLLDTFVPMLEKAGIEAHGWGYCYGNTNLWRRTRNWHKMESDRIVEALIRWRFRSWMVDVEKEFKIENASTIAKNLMSLIKTKLVSHPAGIDVPIGLSSYRHPSEHNTWSGGWGFPFGAFLQYCDFSNPQVYWVGKNNVEEQTEQAVREWNEIKELSIVAAGTIYRDPRTGWRPTGDQVARFNVLCKEMPEVIATCYWEHREPFARGYNDIITALSEFDWRATTEPEPEPEFDCKTEIESLKRRVSILENR
jgi:hypothetical protein